MHLAGKIGVVGLLGLLALGGCAELGVRKPTAVSAASLAKDAMSEPKIITSDSALPDDGLAPEMSKPTLIKGSGEFIDREAASMPEVEVTDAGTVILNFAGADIQDVVRTVLGATLKLNFVMHPNVTGKVTVQTSRPLPRSALLSTLENILRLHGAALVKSGAIYKVLPIADAPGAALNPRIGVPSRLSGRAYGIQIVPLAYVSAGEMERILKPLAPPGSLLRVDRTRNLIMLAGTRDELVGMLEIVDIFDVDWLAGRSVALYPLHSAEAKAVISDLERILGAESDGPLSGLVRFMPIERLNAVLVISAQADYLARAGRWIERLDTGLQSGERKLHVYHVQNGRAADLADILNKIFDEDDASTRGSRSSSAPAPTPTGSATTGPGASSAVAAPRVVTPASQAATASAAAQPRPAGAAIATPTARPPAAASAGTSTGSVPAAPATGQAPSSIASGVRIIADEKKNALVILGTPRQFRDVLAAVRKLDIPPLQVLVEATIAEVTLNDSLRYGVQWFFRSGNSSFTLSSAASGSVASIFSSAGGFSYVLDAGGVKVVLDALAEVTDVNVISSPQLLVLDNETATLQFGDQVPIATQQSTSVSDTSSPLVSTIQFRDTGVILTVTPRVNAGGLVQMDVSQEVSDVTTTTSSTLNSPTIQQRKISSTVAVHSGETVALGGLIRDRKTKTSSGLPFLSEIPIIGALFGTKSDSVVRTELLVLITPRIVRNRVEARRVTEELRSRMRAIEPLGRRIR